MKTNMKELKDNCIKTYVTFINFKIF